MGEDRHVTRGAQKNHPPLENVEMCWIYFKILDIVEKIWAPLGKRFRAKALFKRCKEYQAVRKTKRLIL